MNEADRSPDPAPRTRARAHRSRWPGWIWAVPIAAVGIVVWLLIRAISTRGIDVTVTFDEVAGMKPDSTEVRYRGLKVGTVHKLTLANDGARVSAQLDLDDDMQKYLHRGTRFYLEGAHPSLSDPASLKAIVAGPTITLVPGAGAPERHFTGVLGQAPPQLLVSLAYRATFTGDVGELPVGSPVTLRGFPVGAIERTQLSVDGHTGEITTVVILDLDPTRFHVDNAPSRSGDWGTQMVKILTAMVEAGMRVQLAQNPPLIGSPHLTLDVIPQTPAAHIVMVQGLPELPVSEGGGIQHLLSQAGRLPLREIGNNVREVTGHLDALVRSPQLKDSLTHLNRTLAQLDKTVDEAGPEIAPTLRSAHQTVDALRDTAHTLEATVRSARNTLGGNPAAANGNLQHTLSELTDAARAVRILADDLDQHPESLVRGR